MITPTACMHTIHRGQRQRERRVKSRKKKHLHAKGCRCWRSDGGCLWECGSGSGGSGGCVAVRAASEISEFGASGVTTVAEGAPVAVAAAGSGGGAAPRRRAAREARKRDFRKSHNNITETTGCSAQRFAVPSKASASTSAASRSIVSGEIGGDGKIKNKS